MTHANFVHLSVHSAYSLAEGAIHVKDLAKRCAAEKMPAVAVTDSNNLFGALEFSLAMASAGVQPIIGVSLSLANPYAKAASISDTKLSIQRIGLLAQTAEGYANLIKLVSRAHLETDAGDEPHISLDDLRALGAGLIILTGGAKGPIGHLIRNRQTRRAEELLADFKGIFGDRLYIELMRHGMPDEAACENIFIDMAFDSSIPIVATNEAYFLDTDMFEAHDALLCIAGGTYVSQDDRRKLTPEHRFKSADEMAELFADLPEAIENTLVIAQRCAVKVEIRDPILPNFAAGQDVSETDMLQALAEKGLAERLDVLGITGEEQVAPYRERLAFELGVISDMGFPGYFLIVADFIDWAKNNDVPVGPGRGSGAGSVVAWALKITDLDPLRFGLLFERFLNPERVSMPDFDIDFCQDKRDRVIRYVQEKYGHDQVAQIITFGKLQARAVLRDVGRVMQQPYPVTDRLSKMIPNNPASPVTLAEAINGEPRLQHERDSDELTAAVIDRALHLEGLYRHASTHAAGVVIGDRPLDQLVPLYRDPRSDMPVTQFNMKWVEKAGLVKFDFLGLKTLTVLQRAVEYIRARDIEVDLETIPLDDPKTFELLVAGDTAGVFQLEGSGMRAALRGLKSDKFEDIIALVALYRPGPMDNIPTYIKRKHGEEEVDYLHPWLEDVLDETYGVIIYQEQVMKIAQILAGYSLGQADVLRRAMGKKIQAEMDAQRKVFVDGAVEKGVEEAKASFIFDLVAKFAGYGFNKSHAAAYALVAYQTAYLKANYPVEFMAATMSLDQQNTDKLANFRRELQHMDVALKLPNINASDATFTVEADPDAEHEDGDPRAGLAVRYGLAAIKNVGEKAMESIVAERRANGPFTDLLDMAERVDPRMINKRQMENLCAAGAFDCLDPNRARVMASVDLLSRHAHVVAEQRASAQESLFGEGGNAATRPPLPDAVPWLESEQLKHEAAAIGFYLSSHPLELYATLLEEKNVVSSLDVMTGAMNGATSVMMAGAIDAFQERRAQKSGKPFGYLSLSDASGGFEVLVFSDFMDGVRARVEAGGPVVISASVDKREDADEPRLVLRSIESLDDMAARTSTGVTISLVDKGALAPLEEVLTPVKGGRGKVQLSVPFGAGPDGAGAARISLPGNYRLTPEIQARAAAIPGVEEVSEA